MEKLIKNSELEPNEAKVYLALLELGPSTVSEITKKASVPRTLGYHVLEKLGWHGLVNQVSGKGAKIIYSAEHPRRLVQFVQNKQTALTRQTKELEALLPDLVALYKVAEKPIIRYQQGIEGVKTIYNETLESKTAILSILDIEGWDVPELRTWGKEYNRERSRKKIQERILMLDTPKGRTWMKNYKGSYAYTNYRWIKPEKIPQIADFGGELNIFEKKVMIALLKKPNQMGIIIESTVLASILKALFELAWQASQPIKK